VNGKIYKVFVSSTYEDLREERAAVQKGLLKVGCLPVGMELFPAIHPITNRRCGLLRRDRGWKVRECCAGRS
jgi:hypothetical protein